MRKRAAGAALIGFLVIWIIGNGKVISGNRKHSSEIGGSYATTHLRIFYPTSKIENPFVVVGRYRDRMAESSFKVSVSAE